MQALKPSVANHVVGGNPAFVGRDDILQDIYGMLENPQQNAIFLYGRSGIGKTALLRELEITLPKIGHYRPIFFDLLGQTDQILEHILQNLANQMINEVDQKTHRLIESPLYFRQTWLPRLLANEKNAFVFLLDELNALDDKSLVSFDFLPYLHDLLGINPQKLNFVCVVGENTSHLTQTTLDLFGKIRAQKISLLNQAETFKLIQVSVKNLYWFTKAKKTIWQFTQGHPQLTQQLCFQIWEHFYFEKPFPIPIVFPKQVQKIALRSGLF